MRKTIYSATLDFIEHLRNKGFRDSTLTVYEHELEKVWGFFGADNQLSDINLFQINRFMKSDVLNKGKQDQPLAERTIARTVRVFWQLVNWAFIEGIFDDKGKK